MLNIGGQMNLKDEDFEKLNSVLPSDKEKADKVIKYHNDINNWIKSYPDNYEYMIKYRKNDLFSYKNIKYKKYVVFDVSELSKKHFGKDEYIQICFKDDLINFEDIKSIINDRYLDITIDKDQNQICLSEFMIELFEIAHNNFVKKYIN